MSQPHHGSLDKLREAVRRAPGDAEAWYALGTTALEAGELGEARFAFTQWAVVAPADVERAILAAQKLSAAGCAPEAEAMLRRILDRAPDRTDAVAALARVLLEAGNEAAAVQILNTALKTHPRNLDLHLLAADAHERTGALSEAADHLAAVLAVDLQHDQANRRLGTTLARLGDTRGAVRCWRRVVQRVGNDDLEALTNLGIALSGDGQHAEALQTLADVARRRGGSSSAYADLGNALLTAGQLEGAVNAFRKSLELDPRSAQAYCGLGIAYQAQGRWREAATAFQRTTQLAPDNAVGPLNLGLALEALGDREGARRALLRAAALDPDDDEIRRALENLFAPPAAEEPPSVDDEPTGIDASIAGNLTSFPLPDVLEFLRVQRKTGSLVVRSTEGTGIVSMAMGNITSATAPGMKRLGQVLVDRRLINRPQLEAALLRQRSTPDETHEALGSLLLGEGLIDQKTLTDVMLDQVMNALGAMLEWKEGAFSFHFGKATESPPASFDLQEVMLELFRRGDERRHEESKTSLT